MCYRCSFSLPGLLHRAWCCQHRLFHMAAGVRLPFLSPSDTAAHRNATCCLAIPQLRNFVLYVVMNNAASRRVWQLSSWHVDPQDWGSGNKIWPGASPGSSGVSSAFQVPLIVWAELHTQNPCPYKAYREGPTGDSEAEVLRPTLCLGLHGHTILLGLRYGSHWGLGIDILPSGPFPVPDRWVPSLVPLSHVWMGDV